MSFSRASGILLHPTSLPGRFGVGDLGQAAYEFVDFLEETGQSLWQVLPLGPTGHGDSPYQCFSAFAGNPLLVSLDTLREDGLLNASDFSRRPPLSEREVDFEAVRAWKAPLLVKAFERFEKKAPPSRREAFAAFCHGQASWLDDFALFMALKQAHGGRSWHTWDRAVVCREKEGLDRARAELHRPAGAVRFVQFLFFEQWA